METNCSLTDMALENASMNKESIETIHRFITDATEYIRKKSKTRADESTIIDYVFNKNKNVNVDKQVVKERITFLTTNGTLENKPNGNKNSSRAKDQAKLSSDDIIDNTPASPKIFITPTEAQVTDLPEESSSKHTSQIGEHDLRDLTTAGEQINNLKKGTVALKDFIQEQLYVVKKSVEDLKNQQQASENSPLFESFKDEILYLRAENKNKN